MYHTIINPEYEVKCKKTYTQKIYNNNKQTSYTFYCYIWSEWL